MGAEKNIIANTHISLTLRSDVSNTCAVVSIDTYAAYKRNCLKKSRKSTCHNQLSETHMSDGGSTIHQLFLHVFFFWLASCSQHHLNSSIRLRWLLLQNSKSKQKSLAIHLPISKACRSVWLQLSLLNKDPLFCSSNLFFWQVSLFLKTPVV